MNEILKQIEDSFLTDERKQELLRYFEEHGEDAKFYEMFNTFLIEEIEKKRDQYKTTIEQFDERAAEIDRETMDRREALVAEREEKIANLAPLDVENESRLIDEYDAKEQALMKDYKKNITKILGDLMLST
jgi:hypothetical protein